MKNKEIIDASSAIARKFNIDKGGAEFISDLFEKIFNSTIRRITKDKAMMAELALQTNPPHNLDTELAFLGKAIVFPDQLMPLASAVSRDYFYDTKNSWIWHSVRLLWDKQKSVTIDGIYSTLSAIDKLDAAGGKSYIKNIVSSTDSFMGAEDRMEELVQYYVLRGIWQECAENVHEVMEVVPAQAHEFRMSLIEKLTNYGQNQIKNYSNGVDLTLQVSEYLDKIKEARGKGIVGLHSPITDLSVAVRGWNPGDLIVIGARPGMGKTALIIADALVALKAGEPILFFSLEMTAVQLAVRLFIMEKGISIDELLFPPNKEMAAIYESDIAQFLSDDLPNMPIYIDDTPGINSQYVYDRSMYFKKKYGIKRIYVDYLQLMSGNDPRISNAEQIVSENSRMLKITAKATGCPMFSLSQLSRAGEKGSNKRPTLENLRQSGAIEQDADIVLFIYRDEYYKILEDEDGNSTEGIAEIIIAKNRSGALNTIKAFFHAERMKFTDIQMRYHGYTNKTNINNKETIAIDTEDFRKKMEDLPF